MPANLGLAASIDNRPTARWVVPVRRLPLLLASILWTLGATVHAPRNAWAQASAEASLAERQASVVRFRGEPLFEVRAPQGRLSPPERALAIEERLGVIAGGSSDALDAIQVVERERTSDLLAGEQLVLSVTDADANPLGRTRQQLAADYSVKLERALRKEFAGRSLRGITTALALTALATVVFILLWRLLANLSRRAVKRVLSWQGTRITAIRLKGVELASARRMTVVAARTMVTLRWMLVVIATVIYTETCLGFFPWTRAAAVQFREYLWATVRSGLVAIASYLPNLLYVALIVFVVRIILRGADLIFEAIENGRLRVGAFRPEWTTPTLRIVRFTILALTAVVIFPYLPGAESPALRGVSIFLGVLISFGSTSAVSNVIAGIVMTYMSPFRLGDRVKVGDTVGDIVEANLLVVRIRTIKNVDVTIPNAAVLGGHIVNYSSRARAEGLILHSTVTIGYDVPWRTVHQLLTTAAAKTEGIVASPVPFVLQTSLDDFYVSYQVNAYTDRPNQMAVIYGELHQNIQDAFAEAGVEIMSPHYRAVRDGGSVALPADKLPPDYVSPPLRVSTVAEAASRESASREAAT